MNRADVNALARAAEQDHRFTHHAVNRMQQRGIPPVIAEAALRFGSKRHVQGGAVRYDFDRRAIRRSRGHFGAAMTRTLKAYDGVYVIVSQTREIITVAHRH